jgi:polysaccharide transporter, PST family
MSTERDDHGAAKAGSVEHERKKVSRGLAWISAASATIGVFDILVLFLILHLGWISPRQYGIAALAFSLFTVLDLITDLGLSAAVIQRDDHTPEKISTVFWMNVLMGLALYGLLWFVIAPALSSYHHEPLVGEMLKVYGVKFIFQNVYFMPGAKMRRELRFAEISIIRFLSNVAEFVTKLTLAYLGYGVWLFVYAPLARVLVFGVGTQLREPWLPRFVFRFRETWPWVVFGFKSSVSKILFFTYTSLDVQIVGRYFGDAAAGLYRMATDIALEVVKVLSDIVAQVAFPAFARVKHDRRRMNDQFIAFTRMNLVVLLAYVIVIFVPAPELLGIIGKQYVEASTILRVLCVVGVLRSMSYIIPPLLDGAGRPGLTLIYMSVASIVVPTLFLVFAKYLGPSIGPVSVAIAWSLGYPVAFIVILVLTSFVTGLHPREYVRRIVGIFGCAAAAMAVGFGVRFVAGPLPGPARLVLSAAAMVGVYALLLDRIEGISLRTVKVALKGAPPPVEPEAPAADETAD